MWRTLFRAGSTALRHKAATRTELRDFPGLCFLPACPVSMPSNRLYSNQCSHPVVQHAAPEFKTTALLPNGEFKEIALADYKGKYVVLFFYPLDFTFVCPTEIIEFSDAAPEFEKINTQVIACSCDSHYSHFAWTQVSRKEGGIGQLNIPVLADFTKEIARNYGVLIEEQGIALRGLFIIDPEQKVRQITINDLPVGRSASETLRLVQAFQFNAKHGEVCPASWRPGSNTIKPTPQEKGEYFSKTSSSEKQRSSRHEFPA